MFPASLTAFFPAAEPRFLCLVPAASSAGGYTAVGHLR